MGGAGAVRSSTLRCAPARSSPWSAATGPARQRSCARSHASSRRGARFFSRATISHCSRLKHVFARGLVQVPEGRQLFGRMTVEENLLMGAQRQKNRAAISSTFERVYELFPILKDRRRQLAGNMSGGEQQMCALARGLMSAPRLLTVDELSLGLAPVIVDELLDVLSEIRKQGVTVLLVEQDVFAAFSVADRGYVMEMGRIVREGSSSELANDENVRHAYLGEAGASVTQPKPSSR